MTTTSQKNKPFKIGFWSPYLQSRRGNSITARRIVSGLREAGYTIEVFVYEEEVWDQAAKEEMETCDLYHILHFDRFATWMQENGADLTKPYIVTSGGTDVNEKLDNPTSKELLLNAYAITVFTEDAAEKVIRSYPEMEKKVLVVPQSVWEADQHVPLAIDLPVGYPKILLPSGVRKVKDVFYLLDEVEALKQKYSELKFVITGEPLEKAEVEHVLAYEKRMSWFTYAGSVPFESMRSVYEWADVVINTSKSEGQPIALMEAMYYGKPVIARRNAGNASLVKDGSNGFLFDEPTQFKQQFVRLMNDRSLYDRFTEKGKEMMTNQFSLTKEIETYARIYQNTRGGHL